MFSLYMRGFSLETLASLIGLKLIGVSKLAVGVKVHLFHLSPCGPEVDRQLCRRDGGPHPAAAETAGAENG